MSSISGSFSAPSSTPPSESLQPTIPVPSYAFLYPDSSEGDNSSSAPVVTPSSNPIPLSDSTPLPVSFFQKNDPPPVPAPVVVANATADKLQCGLTVCSVVCGILSLIPPLRVAGNLALRSVSLLSSLLYCKTSWSQASTSEKVQFVAKLAFVVSGIVAVAAASPLLVMASIAADIGIQSMNTIKALYMGDYKKAFVNASILIIDSLMLAAMVTGSWPLITAALSVTALMMTVMTVISAKNATTKQEVLHAVFYGLAAALSIAGAVSISEIKGTEKRAAIDVSDPWLTGGGREIHLVDKDGNLIGDVPAYSTRSFDVRYDDLTTGLCCLITGNQNWKLIDAIDSRGQHIFADAYVKNTYNQDIIVNASLNYDFFATVPVAPNLMNQRMV